ncbi:hypothetical protein H2198_000189 [Neophaeococcomyces mojaviensis]|uniref:Uncharacterized protein n=1 Tax=Neophaeococcomyces mojaviensis TaxID=3383035 RepID=A0ACC3AL46_9EURO|nr:hypothetical protein H2198_000189 [Knufia sp. JES_112]
MKGFPFVLGTDIVQISRFDPKLSLNRIKRLASRYLHPTEYHSLKLRLPDSHALLRTPTPTLTSLRETPAEAQALSDELRIVRTGLHSGKSSSEKSGVLNLHRWVHALSDQELDELAISDQECRKLTSWLAGRWAAKEAARKAWGADIIGFKDVHVEVGEPGPKFGSGRVHIVCEPYSYPHIDTELKPEVPRAQDKLSRKETTAVLRQHGQLSISHDGDYVVATVIAEPLRKNLRKVFQRRAEKARKKVTEISPQLTNVSTEQAVG